MCLRAVQTFDGPDLKMALFRTIIDEGAPYFRYICLDGPGETTLNPEVFDMVRYARARGIRTVFSTNASTFDAATCDAILDSGLDQIILSVNGTTPEVYDAVHGVDGYDAAVANIRRFLARKRERRAPIMVSVQMIRLPETLPQVGDFYRAWRREPGVDFVRVKQDVVRIPGDCLPDAPRRAARPRPCPRLWHGPVFIETDGDVYASPGILYKAGPVGNVRRETLAAIWNNERMQAMRRAHAARDLSELPERAGRAYPAPRFPLILAGFLLDPFMVGRLVPLAERLAFWQGLPLYERGNRKQ